MDAMNEADNWITRAGERLTAAGYRRGGARRAVIGLLGQQRCALSAVEIGVALEQAGRPEEAEAEFAASGRPRP